jgi:hypothetical protein
MNVRILGVALLTLLCLPVPLLAQDATIIGAVKDSTDAVLPGVTVTAVNLDNGNTFSEVTNASGNYRLALRPGLYKITAELVGFTPSVRDKLELQIAQRVTLDLRLSLSGVAENITVTGQAPLVDTSSSAVGGVIDRRQVEDLPVNGRNFVDLSMLAPGSRSNAVSEAATPRNREGGESQINVDGQQVTQMVCCQDSFGNPRYSKDAIAEFEVVTNRFDASQGHSSGFQLNAITKSGTNRFAGSVGGYFRDDSMHAKDFIVNRVIPYQDQQISTTFGGPIRRDRLHFFVNYEYEREPQTKVFTTPFPAFNKEDLTGKVWLYTTGIKFDYQITPQSRAMFKGYRYFRDLPIWQGGGNANTLSATNASEKASDSLFASLTQTFGSSTVNEVKGGYNSFKSWTSAYVDEEKFKKDWYYPGAPRITLNGLNIGGPSNLPQVWYDETYQIRDDLTMLFSRAGRHEMKIGGELLHTTVNLIWMHQSKGTLTAVGGPIPANIEQLIPDQRDWRTWNIAALSPISLFWQQAFGNPRVHGPAQIYSGYAQDNWTVTPRLTLNLGVRYEFAYNQLNEDATIVPFLPERRKADRNGLMPRFGAAYNLNEGSTVLRGGWGKYIAQNDKRPQWGMDISIQTRVPTSPNDGRPNFAADPFNGIPPVPGDPRLTELAFTRVADTTWGLAAPDIELVYSWQSSVGVQHQLSDVMSFEADYVWQGSRNEMYVRNMNLSYDPATGVNYPFTDVSRRPFPSWGIVQFLESDGTSDYHGLQNSLTKRFSNNWQANATYTLSGTSDFVPCPRSGLTVRVVSNCPSYIGGIRTLAVTDQRHRATVNGIWSLPYGLQVSGLYFYGSGARYDTVYGGDRTLMGAGQTGRLGPNGLVAPRNDFVGRPLHRVDMRFMKRVNLGGARQLDGFFEVFNLFNHENYGSYTTNLSIPANFGRPQQNQNVAYLPRILQLGFRFAF